MKKLFYLTAALVLSSMLLSCESQDRVRVVVTEIEKPRPPKEVSLNGSIDATIQVASDTLRVSLISKSDTLYHTLLMIDSERLGYTSTYPFYVEKVLPSGPHRLQVAASRGEMNSVVDADTIKFTATDVTNLCIYDFRID